MIFDIGNYSNLINMKKICLSAIMALMAFAAMAEVKLPSILGSDMVLQRNTEVNLWGTADDGSSVTVVTSWNGNLSVAIAASNTYGTIQFTTSDSNGGTYSWYGYL